MDAAKHCATCKFCSDKLAFNDSQVFRECLSSAAAAQLRVMATGPAVLRGRVTSVAVVPDFSCKHWERKR